MQFGVLFFSQVERGGVQDQYSLVTEVTRYCDRRGFHAVWLPERHFDPMGGIYPNPAVIAGALAPQTKRIRLRAGSVVSPLHHPARVVEDWAIVDNLSRGRVDLALASGWNANDFVLAPDVYPKLRDEWIARVPQIQALWRGDACDFVNGKGETIAVRVYPRPVQPQLNVWLAISRRIESFRSAGELGANVLTMLSGITLPQLAERIAEYRRARAAAGHDPSTGIVTLMLHTYVHKDVDTVRSVVREPLLQYIRQSASGHLQGGAVSLGRAASERDITKMAEFSLERYYAAGLFGDVSTVKQTVAELQAIGVDEVACMLDYGLTEEQILDGLAYLDRLNAECAAAPTLQQKRGGGLG